MNLAKILIYKI